MVNSRRGGPGVHDEVSYVVRTDKNPRNLPVVDLKRLQQTRGRLIAGANAGWN